MKESDALAKTNYDSSNFIGYKEQLLILPSLCIHYIK